MMKRLLLTVAAIVAIGGVMGTATVGGSQAARLCEWARRWKRAKGLSDFPLMSAAREHQRASSSTGPMIMESAASKAEVTPHRARAIQPWQPPLLRRSLCVGCNLEARYFPILRARCGLEDAPP